MERRCGYTDRAGLAPAGLGQGRLRDGKLVQQLSSPAAVRGSLRKWSHSTADHLAGTGESAEQQVLVELLHQ